MGPEDIKALVAEAVSREMEGVRKELDELKLETDKVRKENIELRKAVQILEDTIDEVEQYSRKSSLILSGEGVPEPTKDETTEETRAVALGVIKDKLDVEVKGGIVACHRLRNKNRVIVKFQDMEDRNKVYQAKFKQTEGPGVIVHENLTDRRARQVKVLADMKRGNDHVMNYHTKNGIILARDSRDKRYARIQPSFNRDQILKAMRDAPALSFTGGRSDASHGRFLVSQTLERIPAGLVLNRAESLESLTVTGKRSGPKTRQATQVKKLGES